jgi:CheY-like chemotaxis protein/two-component sensor histidine kinase
VAHDVNNCLQVMLNEVGDLDLALSEQPPDTERATQSTEALLASLRTAAEVCARILTFAKGTPVSQGADASKVLRESMPILSKLTRPKVMLSVDAAEAPLWVPLDATQLQQVIMNLVLNACHAVGDSGTIRVELGEDGDRAEPSVRLRVVDQGCGIPSAILPRIFDPYFSTRPGSEGTGLGLSIVHGMVRAAGGEILVDSEVGRGTRFDVILPKGMPAKNRAAPPSALAAPSPSPSPTSAQHVLIVDDFSPILGAMDKAFRIAGYSNVCVGSAEEALSWLESGSPEICGLVSDVRLPGMSGLELAERLRARWPELPIVFLSGDVGNVPQLAKLGQRMAVLSKPFQLKALVECFQALCQTAPLLT